MSSYISSQLRGSGVQGAVLLTVGRAYLGNDVTHSTLLDRECTCPYGNLPKCHSYRISSTVPRTRRHNYRRPKRPTNTCQYLPSPEPRCYIGRTEAQEHNTNTLLRVESEPTTSWSTRSYYTLWLDSHLVTSDITHLTSFFFPPHFSRLPHSSVFRLSVPISPSREYHRTHLKIKYRDQCSFINMLINVNTRLWHDPTINNSTVTHAV